MISPYDNKEDSMSRKRTPDHESKDTATAVTEPPAAESKPDGQSFADKVGRRKWIPAPDPFLIATDTLVGVKLFESKQDRQMAIKFGEGRPEDKPSQAVIDLLKEAGYRWNPADRVWTHRVTPDSAMSERIEAEWLYQEIRQLIRQEKGIEPGQELPR
jgi:hypothetical protein